MAFISSQIDNSTALEVIDRAKGFEFSQDLENEAKVLKEIWENFDAHPDLTSFSNEIAAEFHRICGYFLANYGRAKAIEDYPGRGEDYLNIAIRKFEECGLEDKVAEAKCQLAVCYHYEGRPSEAETILLEAEECFAGNDLHPSYLRIQVTLLCFYYWRKKYSIALEIINKIKSPMAFLGDVWLLTTFHNHTGTLYRKLNKPELSAHHLKEALRFAEKAKSQRYVGMVLNNLANLYRSIKDFETASNYVEQGAEIFSTLGDTGWLANVLDTKANILFEQNKMSEALHCINQSIEIFKAAKSSTELAAAYWTKIQILFAQNKTGDALLTFTDLTIETIGNIGENTVRDYAEQLNKLIYIRGNDGFVAESDKFRRNMIESALQTGVEDAADYLKLEKDYFENILVSEFPDIAKREGIVKQIFGVKNIEPITIDARIFIDGEEVFSEAYLFIVPENKSNFGRAVVVCALANSLGGLQIFEYDDEFFISELHFDEFSGFYSIDDFSFPMNEDDIFIIGGVVGLCELSDVNMDFINFTAV